MTVMSLKTTLGKEAGEALKSRLKAAQRPLQDRRTLHKAPLYLTRKYEMCFMMKLLSKSPLIQVKQIKLHQIQYK